MLAVTWVLAHTNLPCLTEKELSTGAQHSTAVEMQRIGERQRLVQNPMRYRKQRKQRKFKLRPAT